MDKEIERLFEQELADATRERMTRNKRAVNAMDEENRSTYAFVQDNTVLVSFVSAIFLPYILGMLFTLILFYFYIGIPVMDFFHVYSGLSQFVFWILGLYFIIFLTDIWLIFKKVFGRE